MIVAKISFVFLQFYGITCTGLDIMLEHTLVTTKLLKQLFWTYSTLMRVKQKHLLKCYLKLEYNEIKYSYIFGAVANDMCSERNHWLIAIQKSMNVLKH